MMTPSENQLDLLVNTPWKLLIILDACRSDYFLEVVGEGKPVLSPANCTEIWIRKVVSVLKQCGVKRYYTANPLVGREVDAHMGEGTSVPIWKSLWSRMTKLKIPGVNPWAVNGWVLNDVRNGRVEYPIVVHYLQPHFPAVGDPPFAIGQWGGKWTELHRQTRKLPRPEKLWRAGKLDLNLMRDAYLGNVKLAVRAAFHLVHTVNVDTAITADHGELLGEENENGVVLFGHARNQKNPILFSVPWLYYEKKPLDFVDETDRLEEKLYGIGYL